MFHWKGKPYVRDSGFQESGKFLHVESGILEVLLVESWALESGIQVPLKKIWNPVIVIQNPRRGIHNPRLSWIPLHGAKSKGYYKAEIQIS